MKTCPIWAALITSVVLLQTVSPVFAKTNYQQFPTNQNTSNQSKSDELRQTNSKENDFPDEGEDGIQGVSLEDFLSEVSTGDTDQITGLYVPEFGGFNVIQQSVGNDGAVSPVEGVLTQYLRPASGRVIGLLAHNFASGQWFERFKTGSLLYVVFGDGRQEIYRLTKKERFQALNGNSPTSDFIDLASGVTHSASKVYEEMYTGKPHLTLQTCIQQGNDLNWGRLFLLAELVE